MRSIVGRDVNVCFQEALWMMKVSSVESGSRNGKVKYIPEPVCIKYEEPSRRVLFNEARDANPFFHLMESLWMLHGSNDVAFVKRYNSNIDRYSDDGKTLHGAYGHRWIKHFGINQLDAIASELNATPDSRRCVLQMWDAKADTEMLVKGGKDVPCNTQAYFALRPHGLDLTVMNRSNDLVWGALGANAVHFAFLLEWMAWRIRRPMGHYYQITNNLHIYEQHWDMLENPEFNAAPVVYRGRPTPLAETHMSHRLFDIELERFMQRENHMPDDYYAVPFLNDVAKPMALAWQYRKAAHSDGEVMLNGPSDWEIAGREWILRRTNATYGTVRST